MNRLTIIKEHADTIGVLVGSPARNPRKEGKDLFNAVFLLYEKEIKAEIHKTLLPNYDVFDEYRYFEPAYEWNVMEFKGKKLAVTICEDIWNLGDNPLYRITPMEKLMTAATGCNDQSFCITFQLCTGYRKKQHCKSSYD